MAAIVGCVGGALRRDDYLETARAAGFASVEVITEMPYMDKVGSAGSVAEAVVHDTDLTRAEVDTHLANVRSLTVRLVM